MGKLPPYLLGTIIGGLGGVVAFAVAIPVRAAREAAARKPIELRVDPSVVLGDARWRIGDKETAFTLVEFADFQCPPCAGMSEKIPLLIEKHQSKLSYVFRHYPLTEIHKQAVDMAVLAEAAGQQGKFWEASKFLFAKRGSFSKSAGDELVRKLRLNKRQFESAIAGTAKEAVQADMKEAERLGVKATPTFFVCAPGNKVFKLSSLNQLDELLKAP